jgi:hypothetical protein
VVASRERVDLRTKGYALTLTLTRRPRWTWCGRRSWHARATRGHNGGGQRAEVVQTSGLLGWLAVDPVNRNGDAHWHAHVTLTAVEKAGDGGWSALASAGTDSLFSSVGALGG